VSADKARRKRLLDSLVGKRRKHEVDLSVMAKRYVDYTYANPDQGGVFPPFDFPVYVQAFRLMQDTKDHAPPLKDSQAMLGWTLVVDAFTYGVKVYVRIGLVDGTLKVFVEDSEGRDLAASYERQEQ
jgi:hypothetical protein